MCIYIYIYTHIKRERYINNKYIYIYIYMLYIYIYVKQMPYICAAHAFSRCSVTGNRGTSAMTQFVLTPSGSCFCSTRIEILHTRDRYLRNRCGLSVALANIISVAFSN